MTLQFSLLIFYNFQLLGWKSMFPGLAKAHFAYRGSSKFLKILEKFQNQGVQKWTPKWTPLGGRKVPKPFEFIAFLINCPPPKGPVLGPTFGPLVQFA